MDGKQFLAEFGHIANAPGGMQRLKELILLYGISGRLGTNVLKESNRGLLDEIKLKLTEEANVRKVRLKSFSDYFSFQFPLAIPENWSLIKLGNFAVINMGQSPSSDTVTTNKADGIPFYQGKSEFGLLHPSPRKWCTEPKKIAQKDDILISVRAPVGPTNIATTSCCIGRGLSSISAIGNTNFKYLHYVFRALEKNISNLGNGTTFSAIALKDLQGIPVPVPSPEEQSRIVEKIDELMVLCDRLEVEQEKKRKLQIHLRQAILQAVSDAGTPKELQSSWKRLAENFAHLFSDVKHVDELKNLIFDLSLRGVLSDSDFFISNNSSQENVPQGWNWTTLGELSEYVTSGSRGWKKYHSNSGETFIRSQDIKTDALFFENRAYVSLPEKAEGKRTLVQTGDLLITITGGNVGKCARVPELDCEAYVSQHVALIRLNDNDLSRYIHYWIIDAFGGRKYLSQFIYGDKPGLNLTQVKSIPVPLPPPHQISEIIDMLGHYHGVCEELADKQKRRVVLSEKLATAAVSALTGITTTQQEAPMKAPKTELKAPVRLGEIQPANNDKSPLTTLLVRHNAEMNANDLWQRFGGEIDEFYAQLKVEVGEHWIADPFDVEDGELKPHHKMLEKEAE